MECNINIHRFFPDEINVIDPEFDCLKRCPDFKKSKADLFAVIDKMGQLSAKAQGLSGAITTGSKVLYSDHRLYLLKDTTPSSRHVIGILKVGTKNLFIYDMHGVQHEMAPLCVLDFYVHESRQRQGCGRKLFDFMLAREHVNPRHLAIDRPSHKFLAFLEKHYGLSHGIPQMYKFVVFQGFFRDRGEAKGKRVVNGRLSSASISRGSSSRNNQYLQQQLQELQQQQNQRLQEQEEQKERQAHEVQAPKPQLQLHEDRSEACALPQIHSAIPSRSQRQSPPRHMPPASAHVQTNGSNLVSNLKSLSIHEGSANGPDGLLSGTRRADLYRKEHLRVGTEGNPSRREAQSAPVGATAGPLQSDVTNWTTAAVANGYTYQKGLTRNQRHTRLW